MAPPSETLVYGAIGVREDLLDFITNISPEDNYCSKHFARTTAKARYHEYQTDVLGAAAANAQLEGDDATNTAIVPTGRIGNYVQHLRKVVQVSDFIAHLDLAGRKSEIEYQQRKAIRELMGDVEYAVVLNSAAVAGSAAVAPQMLGILGAITTCKTDLVGEPITVDALNTLQHTMRQNGGKPSTILVGGFNKRKLSQILTPINTRNIDAKKEMVVFTVDAYQSDFGTVNIHYHHILDLNSPSSIIILGELDLWKLAWARPLVKTPLAKTGDSTRVMLITSLTLEVRQEKGSALFVNASTS